ncbi:MAG: hypothetical protein KAI61_02395 [Alphaproteobacteria bacterium]|nr:hypothetical protein [Alphaproteobacteria bacterium]MCK5658317.1 hypothetical protein [Alphaproteobacteria bacterium]
MNWGFDNKENCDQKTTVSLDVLRGQTMQRLAGVHQRLGDKGLSSVFAQSSRSPASNDGLFGEMFFGMVLGGAISAFMGEGFNPINNNTTDDFNSAAAISNAIEVASIVRDDDYDKYSSRHLSDYPQGRRNHALEEARKSKHKFNLVSGGHNNALSFDVQAELACMYEILDMLDNLEHQGATTMRLDKKQPIYNILKDTTKKITKNRPVRRFAVPMKMAL